MSSIETSTDYAHPARPLPIRAFNLLAGLAESAGSTVGFHVQASLEMDALLEAARRETGHDDFGDPYFREPLEVLLRSLETEARLNPLGRTIMRTRIVGMLANRLRVEALFREHPEIEQIAVPRPIVIAGLQRTGTTLLHRLLAADPRARSLAAWEALHPAPVEGEGREGSAKRERAAKMSETGLRWLSPQFFAVHPVEADAPEEDVLLLDHCFTSQAPEATLHVPTYASWLEGRDLVPAYRYLERLMKLLLWQRPGRHWVLKTPHHMEYLAELFEVFPDALVVQTHRDPHATTGSFCSMVAHGRGIFSDDVDPREVGSHWLRKVRRMIERSLAVRDARGGGSFVDVSYYDLVADPLAQARRIYAAAGIDVTPEAETAMRRLLEHQVANKHGRHVYRTRDFGLSPARIEETFADYRARFGIRHEKRGDEGGGPEDSQVTGVGHRSVVTATVTALIDMVSARDSVSAIAPGQRLDATTALVTGASSGLGRAVAADLARRGARVLLACRSGIPDVGEEMARETGSTKIEMIRVDLADLDNVVAFADELARRGETIDLLVLNAGVVTREARPSRQGYDMMFAVHYAANHVLVRRLLASGVIPNDVYATNGRRGTAIPRIVFVSSETHRSSLGVDIDALVACKPFGVTEAVARYGDSKLALTTLAVDLADRLRTPEGPSVAVHCLCPGPIASNLARDAPPFLQAVVDPVMKTLFRSPEAAATPVVYLAAAPELAGETGWYLHLMRRKSPAPLSMEADRRAALWSRGETLLARWLPEVGS
jgi:NAD(P)-dependent dehydrogenase (short-subunit alcohol dehydrogenase family)